MLAPRSYFFTQQAQSRPASPKPSRPPPKRTEEPLPKPDSSTLASKDANRNIMPLIRPTTSSPVVIPVRSNRESSRDSARHKDRQDRRSATKTSRSSREKDHSPDAIPPAVAALLAMTSIPPQKRNAVRKSSQSQKLTVDAVLNHNRVSEREFNMSLGNSPLDVLLSAPEDLEDDALVGSQQTESYMSTRTLSSESVPSLDASSIGDASVSMGQPFTPSPRGRKSLPTRRMTLVSSPPSDSAFDHPLSQPDIDVDELDFRVFQNRIDRLDEDDHDRMLAEMIPSPRRKSAFKSNLTASLKALRSAAKTLSTLTTPMITPDDFLTRSIVTIDPKVPFTDERMPPLISDIPTPALRRYLNPTTNAPIEAHVPSSLSQARKATGITASIQMQTYKISTAKSRPSSVISQRTPVSSEEVFAQVAAGPVARQRDMRENSDFIRIAVMEMLMRKNGKLDEKMPGRAKWALPPRMPSTKAYEVGEGGVPVRWIPSTI